MKQNTKTKMSRHFWYLTYRNKNKPNLNYLWIACIIAGLIGMTILYVL